jgi:hypothetical protein
VIRGAQRSGTKQCKSVCSILKRDKIQQTMWNAHSFPILSEKSTVIRQRFQRWGSLPMSTSSKASNISGERPQAVLQSEKPGLFGVKGLHVPGDFETLANHCSVKVLDLLQVR